MKLKLPFNNRDEDFPLYNWQKKLIGLISLPFIAIAYLICVPFVLVWIVLGQMGKEGWNFLMHELYGWNVAENKKIKDWD
jgi:hypothetical protein